MSTSNFPGCGAYGKKSDAIIPRRAHASISRVPQLIDHTIVHTQPKIPSTRRPVTCLNPYSNTAPTPMKIKNPPEALNSVPCPSPHILISCISADTVKAPKTAPGRPRRAPKGREPRATNMYRKIWCQRRLQKSATEVDIHGRWVSCGHRHAGSRRRMRPMSVMIW